MGAIPVFLPGLREDVLQFLNHRFRGTALKDMSRHERRGLIQHVATVEHRVRGAQALDGADDGFMVRSRLGLGLLGGAGRCRLGLTLVQQLCESQQ